MNEKFLLPKIKTELLEKIGDFVDEIEIKINSNEDATDLIKHFNDLAWNPIDDPYYFTSYYGSMSRDEFVASTVTTNLDICVHPLY